MKCKKYPGSLWFPAGFGPVCGVRTGTGPGGVAEKKGAEAEDLARRHKKKGFMNLEKRKRCVSLHSANEGCGELFEGETGVKC